MEEKITYTYAGDGSKKVFPINWPYIDKDFVRVYLQDAQRGEAKKDITASCRWLSDSQIEICPDPPPYGSTVTITRETPFDRPLAVFRDGSVQLADDLNTVSTQMIHITQEGRDYTGLVHNLVQNASGILEDYKTLGIAVDDLPYGRMASSSWNPATAMLTLYIPQGRPGVRGPTGPPGQGEKGEQGIQGVPGPAGQVPLVDVIDCGGPYDAERITIIDGGGPYDFKEKEEENHAAL